MCKNRGRAAQTGGPPPVQIPSDRPKRITSGRSRRPQLCVLRQLVQLLRIPDSIRLCGPPYLKLNAAMTANSTMVQMVCTDRVVEMYLPSSPTSANRGMMKGAGRA